MRERSSASRAAMRPAGVLGRARRLGVLGRGRRGRRGRVAGDPVGRGVHGGALLGRGRGRRRGRGGADGTDAVVTTGWPLPPWALGSTMASMRQSTPTTSIAAWRRISSHPPPTKDSRAPVAREPDRQGAGVDADDLGVLGEDHPGEPAAHLGRVDDVGPQPPDLDHAQPALGPAGRRVARGRLLGGLRGGLVGGRPGRLVRPARAEPARARRTRGPGRGRLLPGDRGVHGREVRRGRGDLGPGVAAPGCGAEAAGASCGRRSERLSRRGAAGADALPGPQRDRGPGCSGAGGSAGGHLAGSHLRGRLAGPGRPPAGRPLGGSGRARLGAGRLGAGGVAGRGATARAGVVSADGALTAPVTSRRRSRRSRRAITPSLVWSAPGSRTRAQMSSSSRRGAVAPRISVRPAATMSAARLSSIAPKRAAWATRRSPASSATSMRPLAGASGTAATITRSRSRRSRSSVKRRGS